MSGSRYTGSTLMYRAPITTATGTFLCWFTSVYHLYVSASSLPPVRPLQCRTGALREPRASACRFTPQSSTPIDVKSGMECEAISGCFLSKEKGGIFLVAVA
ncbi:hypothetical protein FKM82_007244 [Ascaphus truei]